MITFTEEQRAAIVGDYQAGLTLEQIKERNQLKTPFPIYRLLKDAGVALRKPAISAKMKAKKKVAEPTGIMLRIGGIAIELDLLPGMRVAGVDATSESVKLTIR